ncbi:hypothetical protein B7494_g121 [Chlorociboria aeruginascens]|nr:hypothetical protein B7494_g121 [Chlorociboria aeruginascens]
MATSTRPKRYYDHQIANLKDQFIELSSYLQFYEITVHLEIFHLAKRTLRLEYFTDAFQEIYSAENINTLGETLRNRLNPVFGTHNINMEKIELERMGNVLKRLDPGISDPSQISKIEILKKAYISFLDLIELIEYLRFVVRMLKAASDRSLAVVAALRVQSMKDRYKEKEWYRLTISNILREIQSL